MELKNLIFEFSEIMSISGHEKNSVNNLKSIEKIKQYFDEYRTDNVHNHIFIRKCGKKNAPKLMIDTHFDEIGMIVTEIKDGGFLKVTNIGGIDTRITQAAEVLIYGKKTLIGIIAATPPHLQKPGDNKKLLPVTDLLIDTGCNKTELEKSVEIGTPVGFKSKPIELLNDCLAGKGFDNKACVASAVYAISLLKDAELDWDIYLLLSSKEETSLLGAKAGTFSIKPDAAIILDVNHAYTPDTGVHETCKFGEGPAISISTTADRKLTKALIEFAKANEIKSQTVVEITSTGTNNNVIAYGNTGVPSAVVSLPLKNMHTYNEIINYNDAETLAALISEFIKRGLNAWYKT